jgi:CBS domain-containing protein
MKLEDIMNAFPLTVSADDALGLASQMMVWAGIHHLPVVEAGNLVGLLTDRDIAAHQARVGERTGLRDPVRIAMQAHPQVADPDDSATEAAARMATDRLTCLPIVRDGDLLGVVTTTDILAAQVRAHLVEEDYEGPLVEDVMTRAPLTARPDDLLLDAAATMQTYGIRHMPVVDGDDRVIGMLSDRDVLAAVGHPLRALDPEARARAAEELRVGGVMSRDRIISVRPERTCAEAASAFVDGAISAVPVTDEDDVLVGMLSYVDLLRGRARPGPRPQPP